MYRFLTALAFLAVSISPSFAQLSLSPDEPLVKAQLIAEYDGVQPGKTFTVALRQEITPGWHTYWQNPGDTGLATTLAWQLPEGFAASDLIFPTPARHPMAGMVNYGYENDVMILAEVTPPSDLKIGDTVELKAKANWLVCEETCIPESASLLLSLPVVAEASTSAWASAFEATRKKLPQAHQSKQAAVAHGKELTIAVQPLPLASDDMPEEAYFFPHDGLLIQHNEKQALHLDGRRAELRIPLNVTRSAPIEKVTGDLWFRSATGEKSFAFEAVIEAPVAAGDMTESDAKKAPAADSVAVTDSIAAQQNIGFLTALWWALLGGIILNLMPCVFPVLSLKVLGLVEKAHKDERRKVVIGGFVYLAGVLATFTVLGLALLAAKISGGHLGWGLQLQSPVFVASIILVLFLIGFLLIGAITIGANVVGLGSKWTQGHGYLSTFFTGALAVVVATPCTAPFMGAAIFYALTQSGLVTLSVLWALGVGLALPYVLLTLFPRALKFLPRPGIWMEHFKQFLAFPMWGAAIWLVWVLGQQNGATGVLYALSSTLSAAFGLWLWKTTQNRTMSLWQYKKRSLAILCLVIAVILVAKQPAPMAAQAATQNENAHFESFSTGRLAELRAEKRPVFVNMTAAWCITCLANEKAALSRETVREFFNENGIVYLKGDWTNYDETITQYLKQFGRSGVPIYVFYPADPSRDPVVLPQILTPDSVLKTIRPHL